jgi:hypothetical protein
VTAADDPVSCAIYAHKNNILDQPGWKWFKNIAKQEKKLLEWSIRLNSDLTTWHKYGFGVFQGQMNRPSNWTREMETPCGEMLQH